MKVRRAYASSQHRRSITTVRYQHAYQIAREHGHSPRELAFLSDDELQGLVRECCRKGKT